jgi:hypothetical protein
MIHLGKRAWAYVQEHAIKLSNGKRFVPDSEDTPKHVAERLTRAFGEPSTIGRGEIAYWAIDAGSEDIGP